MGSKSIPVKLKDICIKIGSGATPRGGKESYCTSGLSLIRSQNILDFSFSYGGLAFINDEQAVQLSNVTVQENDVLINITGDSVARACIVPKEVLPARVNQHVSIIRPNSRADSKYILYFLQHEKPHLLSIGSCGGTRNALTKEMLENLELELPAIEEQKRISATLSCLDDKIELNNRLIANLEAQAQAIFKSWFVDFEPWAGVQPSEWSDGTIGDVAELIYSGGTPDTRKPEFWIGSIPWLSSGETRNHFITSTEKTISNNAVQHSSTRLAKKNTIVMASAGQGYTRGQTSLLLIDTYINQSIIAIQSSNYYAYIFTSLSGRYEELRGISDSSSIRGSITTKMISTFPLLIPDLKTVKEFSTILNPIIHLIETLLLENGNLAKTRDTLLPKLMSGEIEVPVEG